jgi:hypothetical protein
MPTSAAAPIRPISTLPSPSAPSACTSATPMMLSTYASMNGPPEE